MFPFDDLFISNIQAPDICLSSPYAYIDIVQMAQVIENSTILEEIW